MCALSIKGLKEECIEAYPLQLSIGLETNLLMVDSNTKYHAKASLVNHDQSQM